MAEITEQFIETAFEIGKKVYKRQLSLKQGVATLVEIGMNQSSAHDYIYSYSNLIQGKLFTRTTNTYGTEYYLQKIYEEEGISGLENALLSLSQHIDYYEQLTGSAVKKRKDIYNKYVELLNYADNITYPDDVIDEEKYLEGRTKKVYVNIYERNRIARQQCIAHHGLSCKICNFNFESVYGSIGKDFIHVHHMLPLSSLGKEYSVNPVQDLIPVCPNCHSMLHRKKEGYTIDEIKNSLK